MDATLIAETGIIAAAICAAPVTTACAARIWHGRRQPALPSPAGAAADEQTSAASAVPPRPAPNPRAAGLGQFVRADGGNRATDKLRAQILAEQNGKAS